MVQTQFCSDIHDALTRAEELKASGLALWFRGQRKPWPLATTIQRRGGVHRFKESCAEFLEWLYEHPETRALSEVEILSIAQHYGYPTTLLDISSSPEVAANFATEDQPLPASAILTLTETRRKIAVAGGDVRKWEGWGCLYCFESPGEGEFVHPSIPGHWREQAQKSSFLLWPKVSRPIEGSVDYTRLLFPHSSVLAAERRLTLYPEASARIEAVYREFKHQQSRAKARKGLAKIEKLFRNKIYLAKPVVPGDEVEFVIGPYDEGRFDLSGLPSLMEFEKGLRSRGPGGWIERNSIGGVDCAGLLEQAQGMEMSAGKYLPELYQLYVSLQSSFAPPEVINDSFDRAIRLVRLLLALAESETGLLSVLPAINACFGEEHFYCELRGTKPETITRAIVSRSGLLRALKAEALCELKTNFGEDVSRFMVSSRYSLSSLDVQAFRELYFTEMLSSSLLCFEAGKTVAAKVEKPSTPGPHYSLLIPPFRLRRFGLA